MKTRRNPYLGRVVFRISSNEPLFEATRSTNRDHWNFGRSEAALRNVRESERRVKSFQP